MSRPILPQAAALLFPLIGGIVLLTAPAHALLLCAKIDKSSGDLKDGAVVKLREVCKTKKDGKPIEVPIGSTDDLACGNGIIDSGEDCDFDWESLTVDLGGENCESQGFHTGTLRCLACSFDDAECHQCGNDVVDAPSEECDGADLAGKDCASSRAASCSVT